MKITHNNKTYIDAATHAGLRCWVTQGLLDKNEKSDHLGPMGDYAKDELIRYAADPDGYRHGDILITDAEDHRKHWPLQNTHRHPLEAVGNGGGGARAGAYQLGSTEPRPVADSAAPAPQPVDGGEWLKIHDTLIQYSNRSPVRWYSSDQSSGTDCWPWHFNINQGATPITPTQAAEWLRNNGHEAVAAEIEGDRFEPLGVEVVVGDRICHFEDAKEAHGHIVEKVISVAPNGSFVVLANGGKPYSCDCDAERIYPGWRILKRRAAK